MVKLLLKIRYYRRRRKIKDLIHDSALGNIAPEKIRGFNEAPQITLKLAISSCFYPFLSFFFKGQYSPIPSQILVTNQDIGPNTNWINKRYNVHAEIKCQSQVYVKIPSSSKHCKMTEIAGGTSFSLPTIVALLI